MKKILIIGGYGYTGKSLAKHLLAETGAHLILAGRSMEKAHSFANSLGDRRVSARQLDAADRESINQALQGVDFVLLAAPTAQHTENVIRAAIDAKADYLDVQYSHQKNVVLNSLKGKIEQAGLCFITEAGYHPGLLSTMIRYAALQTDEIHTAVTAGYLNIHDIPYTEAVDELMEGFLDYQAQVFVNSAWTSPKKWLMRKFDFGHKIGERTCYSMFFEELRAIPRFFPTLTETGFYISGSNWIADMLITPLVMLGLKIAPKRGLRSLGKLTWWGMQQSKPPYLVALKVELTGVKNGQQVKFQAQIEHEDGYELTAIPVVACLLQYLDGSARRPGLWMMGHLVEPARLFSDMQRMGIRNNETFTNIP